MESASFIPHIARAASGQYGCEKSFASTAPSQIRAAFLNWENRPMISAKKMWIVVLALALARVIGLPAQATHGRRRKWSAAGAGPSHACPSHGAADRHDGCGTSDADERAHAQALSAAGSRRRPHRATGAQRECLDAWPCPASRAHAAGQYRADRLLQQILGLVRAPGRGAASKSSASRGGNWYRSTWSPDEYANAPTWQGNDATALPNDATIRIALARTLVDHELVKRITFWCLAACKD